MLLPLAAAAKIGPIEFQNQQALPIRSLAFLPVDGRPNPVSGSMDLNPTALSLVGLKLEP